MTVESGELIFCVSPSSCPSYHRHRKSQSIFKIEDVVMNVVMMSVLVRL